jgi:hypothetical protein
MDRLDVSFLLSLACGPSNIMWSRQPFSRFIADLHRMIRHHKWMVPINSTGHLGVWPLQKSATIKCPLLEFMVAAGESVSTNIWVKVEILVP